MDHIAKTCACGCGRSVKPESRFVSGHNGYERANTVADILARLVPQENGCLLWTGSKQKYGHGVVQYQGRTQRVHKILYEHFVGPVPAGYDLHHAHCGTASCGNHEHLALLTRSEHARLSPIAQRNAAKTHCPRGHAYTSDNLRAAKHGGRLCRECHRLKATEAYHRAQAAKGLTVGPKTGVKTHCPSGHPYSGDNLIVDRHGWRDCRICASARLARSHKGEAERRLAKRKAARENPDA